jgi:hypothetical protein
VLRRERSRAISATVLICCLAATSAGCGGGTSSAKTAEAHLAAAANRLQCDMRADSSQTQQRLGAELRSLAKSDLGLPRVAKLVADIRARERLRASIERAADRLSLPAHGPAIPHAVEDFEEVHHLSGLIYEDEKALGFKCITPPRKPIGG